ncbi:MAG: hypothetical protein WAT79_07260 [Saprospiraceae bacterium]
MNQNVLPKVKSQQLMLDKILTLFEYRMFPYLMDHIPFETVKKAEFNDNLIELQKSIYYLDATLESAWEVDHEQRHRLWNDIVKDVKTCLPMGVLPQTVLRHIEKYEKHELNIRENKWPNRLKMSYFYFYKSCDVKLLRYLIYEFGELTKVFGSLSKWRDFDFVTEVNDDITDLNEDLYCYNGNRFLIQLLMNGKSHTFREFDDFLQGLLEKTKVEIDKTKPDSFDYVLATNTWLKCTNTIDQLNRTIENLDLKRLTKESFLEPYILKPYKF